MHARIVVIAAAAAALCGSAFETTAQERPDPVALLAAQREALAAFAFMGGVWRGQATTLLPSGDKRTITQIGDRGAPGKEPVRIFEMRLTRVGDSAWPGAGAIPPK